MIKYLIPRLLTLGVIALLSFSAKATLIIPTKATLRETGGTPVSVGDIASVTAPSDGLTFIDYTKKGLITLGVDHHYGEIVSEGHTEVELQITTYDVVGGSPNTPFNITLEVDYTPGSTLSFNDRQIYELDGILAYDIEVVTVNGSTTTDLPVNLYIDAELFINRIYDFTDILDDEVDVEDFDNSKVLDNDCDEVDDDLLVRWTPITEAEEYQLEWTYVNDYTEEDSVYQSAGDVEFDFRFNSSRITTADHEYRIPLTYDHGYVIYRVRAVGRLMSDPTKRQYSYWSMAQSGNVNDDADNGSYHITAAWEINKNWQYSVTFAEEGKKKEVVSFFDGSLRNRQMVTLISTNNKAIVGETIYDHQGRPAIQVLPTPVSQHDCTDGNNTLKYYKDFNKSSLADRAYDRTDFDLSDTLTPCTLTAAAMTNTSGASNYYSTSNPETSGAQGYLPDAGGFPFSQVEYTPDNTGRIRRQGGVGETFQLGEGHESNYFYGHPAQIELDRLFGSEVGYAAHYQKNMVIDPNGQVSVSYLDQEGRVIATSLAGEGPVNMIALESSVDAGLTLTDDILTADDTTANTTSTDGLSKTVNETILISSPTDVIINYSEEIARFTDSCLAENICFGCIYDLTIDFKNECGVSLIDSGLVHTLVGHFTKVGENDSIVFAMDCEADPASNIPFIDTIENVAIGNYQLTKTLALNTDALDFYEQKYLNDTFNTCYKSLADFQAEYLANADFSGCIPDTTCEQCMENLPSLEDFLEGEYGTEDDYQLLLDNCKALCEPVSMYESYRDFLMMDMNPGGQYGEYLMPDGTIHPENFALSVYNTDNKLPRSYYSGALGAGVGDWQRPRWERNGILDGHYYDENLLTESKVYVEATLSGTTVVSTIPATVDPSMVYSDADGYYTTADNLANVEDFIANFQPSWAYSLIYYHPEYRILKTYQQMTEEDINLVSSESFDALMDETNTWQAAIDAGFIKSSYASETVNDRLEDFSDQSTSHAYDPFLVGISDPDHWSYYQGLLISKMASYETVGTAKSMAEIAAMTARCDNQFSPGSTCFDFGSPGSSVPDINARNADWVNFKAFYKALKQQYISELSIERSIETSGYYGYNGCIGNSNFNPFAGGFFTGLGSQYLNDDQPCYADNAPLYQYKVKRFILPADVVSNTPGSGSGGTNYTTDPVTLWNASVYETYVNTGNCPVSVGLANLSGNLALNGEFTSSSYGLNGSDAFAGFIAAYSGITNPPTALPVMNWSAGIVNDSVMNVTITDATPSTIATIAWKMHQDSLINWDSITGITDFHATGTGTYDFTAKAVYVHGDTTDYYPIFGSTDLDILNCTFPDVCERNDLGNHLFDLLNAIASTGNFVPASPYTILGSGADAMVESFVSADIVDVLTGTGTAPSTLYWRSKPTLPGFIITSATSGTPPVIEMEITNYSSVSAALSSVVGFSDMIVTGSNTFTLNGVDNTGALIAEIDCVTGFDNVTGTGKGDMNIGSCQQPQSGCTDQANINFNELQTLLTDVLINQDPDYDLAASSYMTENLLGQMTDLSTSTTTFTLTYSDGLSVTPFTFDHQTQMPWGSGILTKKYYYEITTGYSINYIDSIYCYEGIAGYVCDSTRITLTDPRPAPVKVYSTTFDLGTDCDLTLDLREDPITGYQLSNITDVLSFQVTGDPDLYGDYHHFKMIVKLNNVSLTNEVTDTVYGEICLPIRSCTEITTTFNGAEPFPEVVITDPCTTIVTNLAYAAAETAYNDYVDSLSRDFRARYISHCMSTVEEFSRTYDQEEYHFTLYYYDQAGNLVKTVPPEGVEQLDITSGTDDLAMDVASDRENGTHTVITNHRMETLYQYNSLNQLVAQHMPDQDDVSDWTQTKVNGLDISLTTTSIQMVDESIGYLTGYVTTADAPTGSRGYLYQTTDGGSNWDRVGNLFNFDLLKVRMTSSTNGFAVGKEGLALQTVDGGDTWDLMNMHSVGVAGNFVDVSAEDDDNAAFLLENGNIVPYISGVLQTPITPDNPTIPTGTPAVTLRKGNSIAYNGNSDEYIVSLEFVTGTSPDTSHFSQVAVVNIATPSTTYQKIVSWGWSEFINYTSSGFGVIGGTIGDLAFLSEAGSGGRGTQFMQSSLIPGNIIDAAFLEDGTGVIISDNGVDQYLYTSNDKGANWTQYSTDGVTAMTVVSSTSTALYVAVSYANATVEYYEVTNGSVSQLWSNPSGGAFSSLTSYASGSNYILVGVHGSDIVRSGGFIQNPVSTPSFSTYYTFSSGTPYRVKAVEVSGTVHVLTACYVSSTFQVQDIYKIGSGSVTTQVISPSSTLFMDMDIGTNGGTYLLAYENSSQKVYRAALTSSAPSSGALTAIGAGASTLPGSSNIVAMGLHGNYVTLVSNTGAIYSDTVGVSASSTADLIWRDRSDLRVTPMRSFSAIDYPYSSPTHNALGVGDYGVILERANSGTWTVSAYYFSTVANICANLNSISTTTISSVRYAFIVGNNGIRKRWNLNTHGYDDLAISGSPFFVPNLSDISVNDSGIGIFTSFNGKSYYSNDILASTPTFTPTIVGPSLNSVSLIPGSTSAIAVGNLGGMININGSTITGVSGIYGPKLNSVHIQHASAYITVVGDNFFGRFMNTGISLNHWYRILPSVINSATLTQNITNTWTHIGSSAYYSLLGGDNYLAACIDGIATPNSSFAALSLPVHDIRFSTNGGGTKGYIAAGAYLKSIELNDDMMGSYTMSISDALGGSPLSTDINALWIHDNNSTTDEVTMVGNNMIRYKASGSTSTIDLSGGMTGNIRDVMFTDSQHGFVAGDAGLFYKTETVTYNSLGTAYTAMSWTQKDIHDAYTGSLSNINVTAIDFPSATYGIWGGSYSSSPGTGYAAVRVLHVNDQNYSAHFYYDRLGRIVVSQNSRQKAENKYSYTRYDALGRVYEAGEKTENTAGIGVTFFAGIFGTNVGGQYVASVIDDTKLNNWITTQSTTTRKEVTKSYYDRTNIAINTNGLGADYAFNLATQRKRIVHVTYESFYDNNDATYDHATHYDYDIHGNVKTLVQDNPRLGALTDLSQHRFKHFNYVYDLISGNVHRVDYETGQADQWHHAYQYDADNRITEVYTTTKTPLTNAAYGVKEVMMEPAISTYWTKEAEYQYYDHGPLARTVLGEHEVQGLDYVYTLQGWIKAVNSNDLNGTHDPGRDAGIVANDVMSYSLHYYTNDYTSISGDNSFIADQGGSDLDNISYSKNLYNGNIGKMVTTITNPDTREILPLGTTYRYDQLNRLKEAVSFSNLDLNANTWNSGMSGIYGNYFAYDANGNILSQHRQNENGDDIDSLTYRYHRNSAGKMVRNRLYQVNDQVGDGDYADDIDDMGTFADGAGINTGNNYSYDQEGRLIKDAEEEIDIIGWRVDGKVKSILRNHGSSKSNLIFDYDAMGHRIAKHIYNNDNVLEKSTYYILDAQGNTMAVYERVNDPFEMEITFNQTEKHIYGSSRLGIYNDEIPMLGSQNNHDITDGALPMDTLIMNVSAADDSLCLPDAVGKWWFENSGTTGSMSDQVASFSDNNPYEDWMSVQVSANATPGETYTLSFDITNQTNISYNSVEIRNCSGGGIFDYPIYGDGSYQYTFTIPTGWSGKVRIKWWSYEANGAIPMGYDLSSIRLDGAGVQFSNDEEYVEEPLWADTIGKRNYELTNHLGNVLSVISDKVIPADGVTTVYENHFDNIPDNFIYENDFSSSLDGFYGVNGTSTASLSSGRMQADLDVFGLVKIDLPTTAGHKYIVSYNIELDTIGVTYGRAAETVSGSVLIEQYQEFPGTYHHLVEATTSSTSFYFFAQDNGHAHTLYLDDFTVNDVTGEETYEPFVGAYSVSLSIESNRLKVEHLAAWTQPTIILPTVSGHTYHATATLDLESGSFIDFVAFNSSGGSINGVWASSDGTYTFDFTATSSTSRIDFQNPLSGDWTLYIDDFSIEDITTSVAYLADIRQSTDYSPFGVQLTGRNFTASNAKEFRYGFQNQEEDDEIKGDGNSVNFEYRMHDPRLGRFFAIDPLAINYPHNSPYAFSENRVIDGGELEGLEWVLKIYDPQVMADFDKAFDAQDVYEMRRITYQAINKSYTIDEFMAHCKDNSNYAGVINFDKNGNIKAAELIYDANAPEGLTLTNEVYKVSETTGDLVSNNRTRTWSKYKGDRPNHEDFGYPVDVRTVNSPEYQNYYSDYDFIGSYQVNGGSAVYATTAVGDLDGYLKGYGYVKYMTEFKGISQSRMSISASVGEVKGKFTGVGSFDQNTLTGWGSQAGWGAWILGGGVWQGYANEQDALALKNPTFCGTYTELSSTISFWPLKSKMKPPSVTGSVGFTYSKLVKMDLNILH